MKTLSKSTFIECMIKNVASHVRKSRTLITIKIHSRDNSCGQYLTITKLSTVVFFMVHLL